MSNLIANHVYRGEPGGAIERQMVGDIEKLCLVYSLFHRV